MKTKIIAVVLAFAGLSTAYAYNESQEDLKQFIQDARGRQAEIHQWSEQLREEIAQYQEEYARLEQEIKRAEAQLNETSDQRIDRVAEAIMYHETKNGKLGSGKLYNNLCGIKPGGKFAVYDTWQDGYDACVDLYKRLYHGKPMDWVARTWSGDDRARAWCFNVTNRAGIDNSDCYNL